jgi:pimeloyl-ACP methyl ester carboxylesterase
MPFTESFDGNNIYYEIRGDGQPIIFLPCVGARLEYWKYQEPLAENYKLVFIDTAGVGRSDKNREEYTYHSLAKDVIAVIEKEQLENTIIVGHSFGGVIAIEIAALLKEKIKGIITVDSLMPLTAYYASKATAEEMEKEMKNYEGDYQEYYNGLVYRMLTDKLNEEQKQWVLSIAGYNQIDPAILRDMVRQMLLHDYHEVLPKVSCQMRYIIRRYNPEYLEYVLKEQINARIMDDVGHLMNIEDPVTFNKYIEELVSELS